MNENDQNTCWIIPPHYVNVFFIIIGYIFQLITIILLLIMPLIHVFYILPFYFDYYPMPIAMFFVVLSFYLIIYVAMMYYRCISTNQYWNYFNYLWKLSFIFDDIKSNYT